MSEHFFPKVVEVYRVGYSEGRGKPMPHKREPIGRKDGYDRIGAKFLGDPEKLPEQELDGKYPDDIGKTDLKVPPVEESGQIFPHRDDAGGGNTRLGGEHEVLHLRCRGAEKIPQQNAAPENFWWKYFCADD
jgi:hypothetical protein